MTTNTNPTQQNQPAKTQDDDVLQVRDLSVRFDMDRGESRVLDNVDIDIKSGEILGIVGESGSGKSMFASSLLDAVVKPGITTGSVEYQPAEGEPTSILDCSPPELKRLRWEEISMVFQGAQSSFNPTMKIRGHFEETLSAHGADRHSGMDRTRELLSEVYLEPGRVLDSYPHELSGGMKQRVLIALSLLLDPEVLVMDEPTAALDLLMQRSILSLLENIQRNHEVAIVFITHDLPLAAKLADRLAVMYAFEFVETGDTDDVLENTSHPYTKGLLKSTPDLGADVDDMQPIPGSSPDPVDVPSGCSFHPRCPLATEKCRSVDPPDFSTDNDGHTAACHHWEQTSDLEQFVPEEWDTETEERTKRTRSGEPLLSIDDISVTFNSDQGLVDRLLQRDDREVSAVSDVSFDLYEEDILVLVGESGCGKTTLGKTAVGLQEPTDGAVSYRDQDIWESKRGGSDVDIPFDEIRRSLQIIHQDPGSSLNPNRTVQATLEVPLKEHFPEMTVEDREGRIHSLLKFVGMAPAPDYAARYPHQLSGGEKQRVALIRALLAQPDVILADEAVSALDVSLRIEVMDLLLELQRIFQTSYVVVSHNLSNARYLAKKSGGKIGIMYLGKLVEIGTAEEVIENPQHPYTKVLKWSTVNLDAEHLGVDEPPVRSIDIPDPVDPPSGCRFHTRCPEAREACQQETPQLDEGPPNEQPYACFRKYPEGEHPYWDSEPLEK